ncbi:MAG: DUF2797 domain-containing protein [Haloferacaceae archaeon]
MQVVGHTVFGDERPVSLYVSDGAPGDERGALDAIPLEPGARLTYALGPRRCAGAVHDGVHRPCGESAAPYCEVHRDTWVCAKCTGTCLKDEMDCYEAHAVYLAAFAPDLFKVGVTREARLETRLREQGADRGAHLRTVENGRVAREIEASLAERIPDHVRVGRKRAGLGRAVDAAAWRDLLGEFDPLETYDFDYGLDLDGTPVAETLATGTVRGTKGRLLVLDHGGTTYAVDVRDLVGHELESGGTDRDLQSSLRAF